MELRMNFALRKGFTLIELLVTISIIAILIAMGSVAYSNAQLKARDAKRIGDMKDIQGAMEQAYTTGGVYPDIEGSAGVCVGTNVTSYLNPMPTDPKDSNADYRCTQGALTTYCVCADLESTFGNSSSATCGVTFTPGTGDFYCVKAKQ